MEVNNLDEAIDLANGRPFGLDASIFGKDIAKIRRAIRLLEVGAVYVNDMPRHGVGYYPFGGRKRSGVYREGVGYSVEAVTAYKTIVTTGAKGCGDILRDKIADGIPIHLIRCVATPKAFTPHIHSI